MSFIASAGRIIIDKNGATRLDTDEKLFHIIPPAVSGSRNMPQVHGSISAGVNTTNVYNIGTCHPSCTHVIGAVKFSGSSGANAWGAMYNRWASYLGGDFVYSAMRDLDPNLPGYNDYGYHYWLSYRITISNGVVRLVQRVILPKLGPPPGGQTPVAVWPAHTISFNLKCGVWT